MCNCCLNDESGMTRRDFIETLGVTAAGVALASSAVAHAAGQEAQPREKTPVLIRGAFVYPPSEQLKKEGYYSWPGSTFDAENRHKKYAAQIRQMQRSLGIRIEMDKEPLDTSEQLEKFINSVKRAKPDALLLVPFKKSHFSQVNTIIDETGVPAIVLATLGVALIPHLRTLRDKPGVHLISTLDDLQPLEPALKMVRVRHWMAQARIMNIDGAEVKEALVPGIGTQVRTIPHQHFYDLFAGKKADEKVLSLANSYRRDALDIVEPTREDIVDAAKTYYVMKELIDANMADAVMMNCLPGLRRPHKHVPPCMGYMTLRDEGVAMGCESDLDATLTMMLLQELFDRPGFQHNPAVDTVKNHYFCAHCTSASKMNGVNEPAEPFILRSHAEAGWGTVPRVLFKEGQKVTIAKYLSVKGENEKPQMLIYSGEIVDCPPIPPAGGCRTNAETTINELDDVCDLKGHHLIMIYGNYARELRQFCHLYGIEAVV